MRPHTRTSRFIVGLAAALALVPAASAAAATSGTTAATGTVSGAAALAVTTPATASFSSTLDGTDQTPTYTLPTALSDVRGSGSGWNLQISQTQFTTGSQTLPTSASSITGTTSVCAGPGTCTAPTSNVSYASPIALPAGASPTPAKFYNAAVNTGMGKFTITPTVQVSVPANTYAGSYTSTITIASVTGP